MDWDVTASIDVQTGLHSREHYTACLMEQYGGRKYVHACAATAMESSGADQSISREC